MGKVASPGIHYTPGPGIHLGAYQVKLLGPFINFASRCIALVGNTPNHTEYSMLLITI